MPGMVFKRDVLKCAYCGKDHLGLACFPQQWVNRMTGELYCGYAVCPETKKKILIRTEA